MSSISSGTTTTTGYVVTSDTTGALVLKTGASGTTAVTVGSDQSVTFAGSQTFSGGTANGVLYLNGSKVATSGSALTFDGTNLSVGAQGEVRVYNTANTRYGRFVTTSAGTLLQSFNGAGEPLILDAPQASAYISFNVNSIEQMRLNTTGLGIGTSSPSTRLQVNFSSATAYSSGATGNGLLIYNTSTTNGQYAGIVFQGEPAAGNAGQATIYGTTTGSGNMDLAFSTRGSSTLAERARINSGGNLIVGNSSVFPSPALINVVTATGLACGFAFSDNTASARGRLWWGGSDGISLFNTDNSPLRFGTTNAERARITDAGNFGIGISSPQYRLSLGNTVGRKLAIYDDGSSGGVAAGFGTDLSGSPYELSAWAGSPGGGNGVFTWGQVNTTNGAFAERMRIDTSGNLLVGMGSFSSGGIEKTIAVNGNSSAGFQIARSGAVAAYIYSYGSAGFRVETTSSYARVEFVPGGSGGVQLASAGATSWTSLSDERTKTDLVPITDAVQKVSSLRAVTGRFIKDEPETSRSFLIAQDFVEVFPQAVSTFTEKDDDTEYLGLAYTDTIPLLVAAIKEQQALIESLTQRIAALEGQ